MKKLLLLLIFGIYLINFISATFCDYSQIDKAWTNGESPTSSILTCISETNGSVTLSKIGQSNYFTMNSTTIYQNSTKILISFDSNAPVGNYLGYITSDGVIKTAINITITPSSSGECQINPSLAFFSQNIQTGTKTTLPKIVFNPTNCIGSLTLTGSNVYVMGGVTTNEGTKPLSISSIVSDGVNLAIDTNGLSSQTYQSFLYVNAFSKTFTIPFNIIVTTGTNVNSNFSAENLPVCSISSIVENLNQTYTLSCTNMQPDLTISPEVDTNYIIGTGVSQSSGTYIYSFKPIKYGNTLIRAKFYYLGANVGIPYSQEIKISSSGSSIPGTDLLFQFTPTLDKAKSGERIIINLIDNKTKSLVSGAELFIDAIPINAVDGYTFNTSFIQNKEYSLRGKAPGYNDLIYSARLLSKPVNISISPLNGTTLTTFIISPDDLNASLWIDGNKVVNNSFTGALSEGNHEIKVGGDGFYESIYNITVEKAISSFHLPEFKKGVINTLQLNKNTTWKVTYRKSINSPEEVILTNYGDKIDITPDRTGSYFIYDAENVLLDSYEITGWNGKIIGLKWYWWILIFIVFIILIKLIVKNKSDSDAIPYAGSINT